MSDGFFAGIRNVQFPQSVWNNGPLPPQDGLPAPLNNPFDARYNYGSTLLGDLDPYAYGTADRIANQVSYVNKPHSIQKLIPQLQLPRGQVNAQSTFPMSHAIDDSEIAFVMRLDRNSYMCSAMGAKSMHRHKIGTTVDPMINLATVNYLLAGFQLAYRHGIASKWADLLHHLDKDHFVDNQHVLNLKDLRHIVRDLIKPFGVMRGSEKQGGQDEVGLSPATWPVNFVCNLVLDGHERNMINLWCHHEVQAGDDLVLRLKPMPIPRKDECYTLNSYYKSVARQDFESYFDGQNVGVGATHVWQMVPDVMSLSYEPENDGSHTPGLPLKYRMPLGMEVPLDYVWQEFGYWHIGRSQVQFRKYASVEFYNNTMFNRLKVNHLDMTFEPAWCKVPGEEQVGPRAYNPLGYVGAVAHHIAPGMRGQFDAPSWAPSLGLEMHHHHAPPGMSDPMPMDQDQDQDDGGYVQIVPPAPGPAPASVSALSAVGFARPGMQSASAPSAAGFTRPGMQSTSALSAAVDAAEYARRKTALTASFGDTFQQRMAPARDDRVMDSPAPPSSDYERARTHATRETGLGDEPMAPSSGIDLLANPPPTDVDITSATSGRRAVASSAAPARPGSQPAGAGASSGRGGGAAGAKAPAAGGGRGTAPAPKKTTPPPPASAGDGA